MGTFVPFAAAIAFALFFPWRVCGEDTCRVLEFLEPEAGKRLENHLIISSSVDDDKQCRLQCYLESSCLSYNLKTQGTGNYFTCELSNSDHYQHPGDLVSRDNFWYHPAASLCGGHSCPPAASCVPNKHGKLRCVCPAHWPKVGNCERDTDECVAVNGSSNCSTDAYCNNTVGSFTCTCKKGFTGDGHTCQNEDECTTGSHKCHVNATCTDTTGSYNCSCKNNSIGDGVQCIGLFFHWALDGTDSSVSVYPGASYIADDGRNVLSLNGSKQSYAETPAIPIQNISFSILCWVMMTDLKDSNIYSDWSYPFQFRLHIGKGKLGADLRGPPKGELDRQSILAFFGGNIIKDKWTHVAFTWSRENRTGKLYNDAAKTSEAFVNSSQIIDLNPSGHTVFDIGLKRDSGNMLHGYLRDLMVIDRAISDKEVKDIFAWSKN